MPQGIAFQLGYSLRLCFKFLSRLRNIVKIKKPIERQLRLKGICLLRFEIGLLVSQVSRSTVASGALS